MFADDRGWRFEEIGVVAEGGEILVDGVDPWTNEWKKLREGFVQLPHPQHRNQLHSMDVYSISTNSEREVHFAAGEVSAGVWAFYHAERGECVHDRPLI
ncbi:hypothetical protein [Botrimarina mediterranea]|uniref:hypothetical protein n=1 Tax=Botrimarina mediterranea TaxID=2528022 RepID=UPI0011A0EC76|nr:hypothetical protein [Botrimarina mediterranea]